VKQNTLIITLLLIAFLTGCSYVVSKHPVGLEKYPLNPDEWDGTWLHEDEVITIKVADESKGIVQIAWIETNQEKLTFESVTCQVMKGTNWLYINELEFPDENDDGFYFWGKLRKENRKIIFWVPSVEAFQEAAEDKQIHAIVNKTDSTAGTKQRTEDVRLLDKPAKIIDLIENNGSKFFEWEEPIILIKLGE